uniref:ATP synthase F0 subunit 8 n=1 Tax=Autocrates maqueti TaxID=2969184 RepID=UPI0023AB2E83|nr:ATP synthase F0 subunit 8 [Autocrates maqueti]WCK11522.1 ATP synthase F0 subunit 8 [Autocrates maqueti]
MPQMAPLNWVTLMIYFSIIFIFFNSLNYYSFTYFKKPELKEKSSISLNWKW